jgi:hypothetical protein
MILGIFKAESPPLKIKPRDLIELEKARASQRKVLRQVDTSSDVLSALVRNMKGPTQLRRNGK